MYIKQCLYIQNYMFISYILIDAMCIMQAYYSQFIFHFNNYTNADKINIISPVYFP